MALIITWKWYLWSLPLPSVFPSLGATQWPEKNNVYASILGNAVIRLTEENVTGQLYLQLLENVIDYWAASHYFRLGQERLNDRFPDKWISRRGPIEWPAKPPDLTPLDFLRALFSKSDLILTFCKEESQRNTVAFRAIPKNVFGKGLKRGGWRLFPLDNKIDEPDDFF